MTAPTVHRCDAAAFLHRAGAFLAAREAENNLPLSIAARVVADGHPGAYFAVVEEAGAVVGAALRTPPFFLVVTDLPDAAIEPLLDDVARVFDAVPGAIGPGDAPARVARAWAARVGKTARAKMEQRLFQLDAVVPPADPPPGRARVAVVDDVPLVASWVEAFAAEAAAPMGDPRATAELWISSGACLLWDDGGPRAMAARVGETPRGARIGAVYTPPAHRRRGDAQAATTALSARVLGGEGGGGGKAFCFLYTDLANPTSNAIYARIGYRPVGDAPLWVIE